MSYQVIARKYRPQRFSDVVGQEHVSQTLSNAIASNRIAHAYLFVGPRGTGKTTIARIFAKCLNCTGGPKVDFPDDDPRCQEITEGRSLDVLEIDGASNRGIEEIRELRDTVKYAPATSKFKIYIIDEVHMLTKEAFNALLKTLEEPPAHVKFMFATTEPEKVLPTILSRCQRFDLRRIPSALITKHLAHISKLEKVKIDSGALDAIARGAEGGMRDAESTLDQLISFCGDKIEEADVLSMFGLTARGQILGLSKSILAGQADVALRELNDLSKNGKDLGRLVSDLLNHFRNLLIFQVSKGDLGLLEVSEAEAASLSEQGAGSSTDALTRIMEVLSDCEMRLRDASSKKILVEVALLKAIEARNAVSIDNVLQQLQQLRNGGGGANAPVQAATPVRVLTAAPVVAQASATARPQVVTEPVQPVAPSAPARLAETALGTASTRMPAGDGNLDQLWGNLVEAVGKASPFAKSYFLEAHPVSMSKTLFTIGFDPEFADHIGFVDNAKNHALLQTKLGELGYHGMQIKFVKAERPTGWALHPAEAVPQPANAPAQAASVSAKPANKTPVGAPAAPQAARERPAPMVFNKEDFKNDPLIKKALEVFKGTIVEVRA
ncbi:DNA polymerase III subunit gamma/tau [Pedosphaera parvula]|uniref:DNA polymerase III subunit gamma/tau n=1 Tax=Pedosphaera parvula (strain Ellin514) TaxID=320771 RepID=B9XNI3_PEDPL|nr:DNA polymerase III subunit gamma/tau [Pedosphaera parvula]EEF58642.1 DNA polymerase III, subunits gamma and tau [Pedosphaera parvula Ellin514]